MFEPNVMFCYATRRCNADTEVVTTSGTLQGFIDFNKNDAIFTFRNVPFAQPPVGPLRFRPPQPIKTPPSTVIDCFSPGNVAVQNRMPFDTLMEAEVLAQSEDCLNLNIWTRDCNPDAKRPVMVFIHSGAWLSGSGSQRFWHGGNLARKDVIVVTFNYRLGMLGFLSLDSVVQGDDNISPNLGLLDQIAALQWVKDNIRAFGGDPDCVTIFGTSAGAGSALCLLSSPLSKGLFKRCISQSAPIFAVSPQEWAKFKSDILLRALGITADNAQELFEINPQRFVDVQIYLLSWPNFIEGLGPIAPSVDNKVLNGTLLETLLYGDNVHEDVDILIGWTKDEFNMFFPFMSDFGEKDHEIVIDTFFTHVFGRSHAERAFKVYSERVLKEKVPAAEVARILACDVMCRIGSIFCAEHQAKLNKPIYAYQWDYESNGAHGIIKAALTISTPGNPILSLAQGDQAERECLCSQMTDALVAFVKTGNPNHEGIPHWPKYDNTSRQTMVFDRKLEVKSDVYSEGRKAWEGELQFMVKTPVFQLTSPRVPNGFAREKRRKQE